MRLIALALASAVGLAASAGCLVSSFDKVDDIGGGGSAGSGGAPATCESGQDLPGCCLPNGLCGYDDGAQGCVATETFGDAAAACSSHPCGSYCLLAEANGCPIFDPLATPPVLDCADRCIGGPCTSEIEAVIADCKTTEYCWNNGDPAYQPTDFASPCRNRLYDLAQCFEEGDGFGPECTQYCTLIMTACTGAELQYETGEDCLDVCDALFDGVTFPLGSFNDGTAQTNSVACRFVAIGDEGITGTPAQICSSAGPAGGSGEAGLECGKGLCESYCALANKTCAGEFPGEFGSVNDCISACENGGGPDETFAWQANPSGGFACRLNHVILAITDSANQATHCQNAMPSGGGC